MENQSVLAISLPEADFALSYVQSHWNGSSPPAGAPAHITLLYPWMPPALINEKVLSELTSLFSHFSSFDCSLRLGWFGREVLLIKQACHLEA